MMRLVILLSAQFVLLVGPAAAQGWSWGESGPPPREWRGRGYYDDRYYGGQRRWYREDERPAYRDPYPYRQRSTSYYDEDQRGQRPAIRQRTLPSLTDGGARPEIAPIPPERIAYRSHYQAGTIIIDTAGRQLLLIQGSGTALRYPISVGREGFAWTGEQKVSRIAAWPDWYPPAEMRQRDPKLPEKMSGGLRNPLGAKALYLGNTLYRIHGTNNARSIGQAQSSGCFRMLNGHVVDLAERVRVGTKVVVARSLRAAEAAAGTPRG